MQHSLNIVQHFLPTTNGRKQEHGRCADELQEISVSGADDVRLPFEVITYQRCDNVIRFLLGVPHLAHAQQRKRLAKEAQGVEQNVPHSDASFLTCPVALVIAVPRAPSPRGSVPGYPESRLREPLLQGPQTPKKAEN